MASGAIAFFSIRRPAISSPTPRSTAKNDGRPSRRPTSAGAGGGQCGTSCRRTRTTARCRATCARFSTWRAAAAGLDEAGMASAIDPAGCAHLLPSSPPPSRPSLFFMRRAKRGPENSRSTSVARRPPAVGAAVRRPRRLPGAARSRRDSRRARSTARPARTSRTRSPRYRRAKKLQPNGQPDCDTWKALGGDPPKPTVTSYTLTDEDVKGPFEKIPPKLAEQGEAGGARLSVGRRADRRTVSHARRRCSRS